MAGSIFSDINPATTSGTQLATLLNDFKDIIRSGFIGTSRPTNLSAGGSWIDNTDANLWLLKVYTGSTDITVLTVDIVGSTISVSGASSSFAITKTSADTVGAVLNLIKKRIANSGQTLANDVLGEITFQSTTNAGVSNVSAKIKVVAADNAVVGAYGAYIAFEEINSGGTSLTEKARIMDGKLGVGATILSYDIHSKGTLGIGAENEADSTTPARFTGRKKRVSNSGRVDSGDAILQIKANSTDDGGTEVDSAFVMTVSATQNHTASAHGSKADFSIKKTGATSVTLKMSIGDILDFPDGAKSKDLVLGSNGTAATNSKLHRPAAGKTQIVLGNDATAEGSEASVLGQLSARMENFTDAGKPAAGNIGRIIYVTDTARFEFDNGSSWDQIGGGKLVVSTQGTLTSAAAITFSGTTPRRMIKVASSSGEQDLSALSPQIQAGVEEGQELILCGTSDTNYIILKNGNGLKLNGDWISAADSMITMVWTNSKWIEKGRA